MVRMAHEADVADILTAFQNQLRKKQSYLQQGLQILIESPCMHRSRWNMLQ